MTSASTFIITMCLRGGDRGERDFGTDVRIAGGIDDHVHVRCGADVAIRLADREAAARHDALGGRGIVRHFRRAPAVTGDASRGEHVVGNRIGSRDDFDPAHESGLHHDVGPHLARADQADAHGLPLRSRRSQTLGDGAAGAIRENPVIAPSNDALAIDRIHSTCGTFVTG